MLHHSAIENIEEQLTRTDFNKKPHNWVAGQGQLNAYFKCVEPNWLQKQWL
jgi:hypothetical protein